MRPAAFQSLRKVRAVPSDPLSSRLRICASCRFRNGSWKRWNSSTPSTEQKPYYITTPIFYVNAAPHIGHLYTLFLTDVIRRWQELKGRKTYLLTGTDEHGMKIQQAAASENMDPKDFCDANSQKFVELVNRAEITPDGFIRTTDREHKNAVGEFWLNLKYKLPEQMGMYKGAHEGWYCVSDECFYPEKMVKPSLRAQTGQKVMINTESENEVEWVKEETWFFPLKKYKDALLKFYDENPGWIQPVGRMNEVRNWVENNLEDLSVTRPFTRLNWGITDPEDPSQTIYVWVDALINYLTKAGYGSTWRSPHEDTGMWPADLHVIGKDILRFHAIYWPAMLMSLGLPLPKKILCHNHLTMSNRKMSKSRGNVVNPLLALERWDVEPLRYFLMLNSSYSKDMPYGNDLIEAIYQKHLMSNLGNLMNRVAFVKAKNRWSVNQAVRQFRLGILQPFLSPAEDSYHDLISSLEPFLRDLPPLIIQEMDNHNPAGAIKHAFELLRETNRYISECQPWRNKTEPWIGTNNYIIFHCAEALRICGILLQPIMPLKMTSLLNTMGVDPNKRSIEFAVYGGDLRYGKAPQARDSIKIDKWASLFPPPVLGQEQNELYDQVREKLKLSVRSPTILMAEYLKLEAEHGEERAKEIVTARVVEKDKDTQANQDAVTQQLETVRKTF